jgi:hypothetical protein
MMAFEDVARKLLAAGTHYLVRDRTKHPRRLIELDECDRPLKGKAKRQACASYIGAPKYTYIETLAVPAHLHMLKRVGTDERGRETGQYVRW